MLNQNDAAVRIIELVNDLVKNDPTLAKQLFNQEWKCNDWTAEHQDVTVDTQRGVVRFLGLLNGIVGRKPDSTPFLRAIYNKKGIVKLELNNGEPKSS